MVALAAVVPLETGLSTPPPTSPPPKHGIEPGRSREETILANLALVTFVVNRMKSLIESSGIDRDDAIGHGVEGLIQAIDAYDHSRGVPFASFAVPRVRGAILDAVRRLDPLPRTMREATRLVDTARHELATQLGRWPTVKELALKTGLTVERVRVALANAGARVSSLESSLDEDADDTAWQTADPDETVDPAVAVDERTLVTLLDQALSSLSGRDRTIVEFKYKRAMPFQEIARRLNISESRVCQLHKRIITNLRRDLNGRTAASA
jgi:RNA polymerase sigma factor for flagellar operon FliA